MVAVSGDGQLLCGAKRNPGWTSTVFAIDTNTGHTLWTRRTDGAVNWTAVTQVGCAVYSQVKDAQLGGRFATLALESGDLIAETKLVLRRSIPNAFHASYDGQWLLTSKGDQYFLYDVANARELWRFAARCAQFFGHTLRYRPEPGWEKPPRLPLLARTGRCRNIRKAGSIPLADDYRALAGRAGELLIRDRRVGKTPTRLNRLAITSEPGTYAAYSWSPDTRLVFLHTSRGLEAWDWRAGRSRRIHAIPRVTNSKLGKFRQSPRGTFVAYVDDDDTMAVVRPTGELQARYPLPDGMDVSGLDLAAVGDNGQLAIVGTVRNRSRLYLSSANGSLVQAHAKPRASAALRFAATGGRPYLLVLDGESGLWVVDVSTGERVHQFAPLRKPGGSVYMSLAVGPDGRAHFINWIGHRTADGFSGLPELWSVDIGSGEARRDYTFPEELRLVGGLHASATELKAGRGGFWIKGLAIRLKRESNGSVRLLAQHPARQANRPCARCWQIDWSADGTLGLTYVSGRRGLNLVGPDGETFLSVGKIDSHRFAHTKDKFYCEGGACEMYQCRVGARLYRATAPACRPLRANTMHELGVPPPR